ncbi:MAG: LLM class flavin-dependent oxidoreductase [Candidatus Limnocylindria bacterium]
MTKRVEFGLRLPVAGPLASVDAVRRISARGEQLGFDCLWVHDFIPWTSLQDRTHVSCASLEVVEAAGAPPQFFESLTNLAFVAGITSTIRIGVAVLCLPFRNPIIAAKQVANVDVLSDGRLILGIGVGAPKTTHNVDFEVLGVSRKDKYPRTKDYFKAMRTIWTEDFPSYEGEFISFPETEINPKPVQKPHPPVWVGGGGPNSVDIAAELATGWLPPFIAPDGYPARIRELQDRAAEYGRGDVDFDIGTEVYVSVAETSEKAQSQAAHTLSTLTEGFADHPDPEAIQAAGLIGTPDEISEKLRHYVDAGVLNYEMKFIYQSIDHYDEQLTMFAEGVTPNFR